MVSKRAFFSLAISVLAISLTNGQSGKTRNSPAPSGQPDDASPLVRVIPEDPRRGLNAIENEISRLVKDSFSKSIIKCGSFYYYRYMNYWRNEMYEIRTRPTVEIQGHYNPPRQLSEVERLNGVDPQPVEWEGKIALKTGISRITMWSSGRPTGWGQWMDPRTYGFVVSKAKGKWDLRSTDLGIRNVIANCNEVPGYVATDTGGLNNVALGKPVRISTNGAEDLGDAGPDCNNPAEVTDGNLGVTNGPCSNDGVVGYHIHRTGQALEVTVTIDLQKTYRVTKIHYNQGNVQRAESWNADLMISPFGTAQTNPGSTFNGAWTEQSGSLTTSTVKITFQKTKATWNDDWLFIGEIQIIGVPASNASHP